MDLQREYKLCWQLDPLFSDYFATIGHVYFGVPLPRSGIPSKEALIANEFYKLLKSPFLRIDEHKKQFLLLSYVCILFVTGGMQGLLGSLFQSGAN